MTQPKPKIRTRIAPSPTGLLHIGTARTALFNWLFAHRQGGVFVLRIEDTDLERSDPKYEKDIIEHLRWLGIEWDEGPDVGGKYGPYRQSERSERYGKALTKLLEQGIAYRCFCSKEQLETERQAMLARGEAPRYSGRCRDIPLDVAKSRIAKGEPSIIRFRVGEETITFHDVIRGDISFDAKLIGDLAIAKDERTPLYNFAVVVDDADMEISHVIRGEDHISNTPRQILIQRALGVPEVTYAHLPLILAPDRSKMSKRVGLFGINDFKTGGYLPEAMLNFMALLGWHPEDDREFFTTEELFKEFDLSRVQKSGAVFNVVKLDWLNAEYIKRKTPEELLALMRPLLSSVVAKPDEALLLKVISIERERMKKLSDFTELAGFFFELPDYPVEMLNWKTSPNDKTKQNLARALELIGGVNESKFTAKGLEAALAPLAEELGKGDVYWPLRVSLSGKKASPGPLEIMEVLGKEESMQRIQKALKKL